MIVYALRCACGHEFDQWFDNMADFDTKKTSGIACPTCGGTQVAKAIMAPRVKAAAVALPACSPAGCGNMACPMAQGA